jgi:integrase
VGEACHLKWKAVGDRSITVESSSDWSTKSGKSREVPVGVGLIAFLDSFRSLPDDYIVADITPPRPSKYGKPLRRAEKSARRLCGWLHDKGITDKRPIHYLRKVFASVVTAQHDIHTASKWLGHSSVVVTERVYSGIADDKYAAVI